MDRGCAEKRETDQSGVTKKKIELIETINSEWRDLYEELEY